MFKRIELDEAQNQLSAMIDDVQQDLQPYLIERRGRSIAALVSIDKLERLELEPPNDRPQGALALVGAWAGLMTDEEIDAFITDVYEARARDMGRPVNLEE